VADAAARAGTTSQRVPVAECHAGTPSAVIDAVHWLRIEDVVEETLLCPASARRAPVDGARSQTDEIRRVITVDEPQPL
jgi:hypothetical protein